MAALLPLLLPMLMGGNQQSPMQQQQATHHHIINVGGPTVHVGSVAHGSTSKPPVDGHAVDNTASSGPEQTYMGEHWAQRLEPDLMEFFQLYQERQHMENSQMIASMMQQNRTLPRKKRKLVTCF